MKSVQIEDYLPLIRGVIKRYGLSNKQLQEDLEQEGFLGILEAQKRFDPSKGVMFSTYAYFWVKKKVLAYLGQELDQKSQALSQKFMDEVAIDDVPFEETYQSAKSCLAHLPEDMPDSEQEVLELFFDKRLPLSEIAKRLGFSREKVRALKVKALRRLKANLADKKGNNFLK